MSEALQVQELLKDHQLFHSEFQMDNFIIRKAGGLTAYGQYKQALRELSKRYRGLKQLGIERALQNLDARPVERGATEKEHLQQAKALMALEDMDAQIADTERELNHFCQRALALKKHVGELTPERRRELETELWLNQIKGMAALDYMTMGRLSRETMEMVLSLSVDLRRPMLVQLKDAPATVAWLEGQPAEYLLECGNG